MESYQTANTPAHQLDYSPLSQHIGNVEALQSMVKKYKSSYVVITFPVVVILSMTAVYSPRQLYLVIPALVVVLIITIVVSISNYKKQIRLESFADKNGLKYKENFIPLGSKDTPWISTNSI